jgi:hypothetical protein
MKWLVQLYPRAWRHQYEKEFTALLEEVDVSFLTILDVVLGACDAHYQQWKIAKQLRRTMLVIVIGIVLGIAGLYLTEMITISTLLNSDFFNTLTHMLAMAVPVFGLIGMILHLFLGIKGIKLLKEVRDSL